jgi:hypothetical protein
MTTGDCCAWVRPFQQPFDVVGQVFVARSQHSRAGNSTYSSRGQTPANFIEAHCGTYEASCCPRFLLITTLIKVPHTGCRRHWEDRIHTLAIACIASVWFTSSLPYYTTHVRSVTPEPRLSAHPDFLGSPHILCHVCSLFPVVTLLPSESDSCSLILVPRHIDSIPALSPTQPAR